MKKSLRLILSLISSFQISNIGMASGRLKLWDWDLSQEKATKYLKSNGLVAVPFWQGAAYQWKWGKKLSKSLPLVKINMVAQLAGHFWHTKNNSPTSAWKFLQKFEQDLAKFLESVQGLNMETYSCCFQYKQKFKMKGPFNVSAASARLHEIN